MSRILILNRRCIKHPEKGGAESYTYYLAKALVDSGYSVEWFSSEFKCAAREEVIDGIKFIRKGNELTTHLYGFLYALKNRSDLIIDEFNGVGFCTFLMRNSILLIHQLYDNFWTAQLGILGIPFKYIERFLLRLYRKKPTMTVSKSTAEDLQKIGFRDIKIIPNGVEVEPVESPPDKKNTLSLVYLGRLKKTKNPEDAIKAFILIKKQIEDAKLHILGDGPLISFLKGKYGGQEGLVFHGYVDEREKLIVLEESHFLLVPSIREGWGQVVIQANAMGTPAIGYNVPGLRDSVVHGKTGVLVKNYIEMAETVKKLWQDKEEYNKMVSQAIDWAKKFSWQQTQVEFLEYLKGRGFI